MPAIKSYRASLRGQAQSDRATSESVLMEASRAYVDKTALYGEDEASVVNLLHLAELGEASYWHDMTSNARSVEARMGQAVSAYSKVMFATGHLPGLLSLVRETSAVDGLRTDERDSGALVLRLYDSVELASSPDRMARLIDAVDMIYSACASMSGMAPDSLRLMSVTGVAVRTVVFHGEVQTVNVARKVITYLNDTAAKLHKSEQFSAEAIASEMPLLDAIDELVWLDSMKSDVAASSGRDAQEGAIMLLECGAQLVDHELASESAYIPTSVIARLDADGKSFDNIDSRIGESIDARYDEVYEREKQKLQDEPTEALSENLAAAVANNSNNTEAGSARGERVASKSVLSKALPDNRKDSIDELIIDLNRLYGEQR